MFGETPANAGFLRFGIIADASLTLLSYLGLMKVADTTPIRLFVLGDARIETSRGTIEPTAEVLFAAALYLILERKQPVSRRALEAVLWPLEPQSAACHRLRQTLHRLRRLGVPIDAIGKTNLVFRPESVTADYEDFLASNASSDVSTDHSLILLPGYEPRFSAPLLEWLDTQKSEIGASIARLILGAIASHRTRAQWSKVESNAHRLLRMSPYNEEANLALAEAFAMRGEKIEAVRILDGYLTDVGNGPSDLKVPAATMRKRIAESMPARPRLGLEESLMVGRSLMMERLSTMLSDVRAGHRRTCLISGAAGIGKTRLAAEFTAFASLQGLPTQRALCRSTDPHRPLSIFVDLVPRLRAMRGSIGCSPQTMSYLDRLTKHSQNPSVAAAQDGESEFIHARVQRALFDLLDAVLDETPLILLIEDVHWIDSLSAQILADMHDWSADRGLLLALTGRDEPAGWLARIPDLHDLRLEPLEETDSSELLRTVLRREGQAMGDSYLEWCIRVAEGNPYFLQELANHWIDTHLEDYAPASLTAVLNQRISRLSQRALQLLQTCAILEKHATLERVEALLGTVPHQLLEAITELSSAGMLLLERADGRNGGADHLTTRHELLSTASLARLPSASRAFLHRRAGIVLEREVETDMSTATIWDCAKHWLRAGDSKRAFSLASRCAQYLVDVGLPSAAAEAYGKALLYCSESSVRLTILGHQARAYQESSEWAASIAVVNEARALTGQLGYGQHLHDDLELISLRARWRTDRAEEALAASLQCLACDSATPNHRVAAGSLVLMLLDVTCRHDDIEPAFQTIESLSKEPGVDRLALLEARMVFHTLCGNLPTAIEAANELIASERIRDKHGNLFRFLCNSSVTYRTAGLFANAVGALEEAVAIAQLHRAPSSLSRVIPMLAHLALERGLVEEARSWYESLVRQPTNRSDVYVSLDVGALGARFALLDGDPSQAAKHFQRSLDELIVDRLGQRRVYGLALYVAIEMAANRALTDSALEAFEAAHIASRRCLHQAFAATVLRRALHSRGQSERAEELFRDYAGTYRRERWAPVIAS
ncbi:MAG: AAA family ATPase [Gemmatimonadaceae bacterium]|nr:AAA family ATPase [Gemmatimonadaceae bacterium]